MFIVDMRGELPDTYNLYFIGDTHEGRVGVMYKKWKRAIKNIKNDPVGYCAFMGDAIEARTPKHKKYSPFEQCEGKFQRIELQCENVGKIFRPIKHKILAWLLGNHDEEVEFIMDTSRQICKNMDALHIPHGGRTAKILISKNIKVYITHGSGTVNSRAGDPRQIETNEGIMVKRKLRLLQGDCILMGMGHIHKMRIDKPFERLAIVGEKEAKQIYPTSARGIKGFIPENYRYYFSSGCFCKSYIDGVTTYIEKAMYAPTELGMIKASIKNDHVVDVVKEIY